MLDINITAWTVPDNSKVLFIGDPDQLPSVGAGNVIKDIFGSKSVPIFNLTQIFRQAEESFIIQYAHKINKGSIPQIESPFEKPHLHWQLKIRIAVNGCT